MKRLEEYLDGTSKFIFTSSIIIMVLTHGFCFANLLYSHDSLGFFGTDGLDKVRLGRWLYPFLVHIRLMASPWVIGAFSILYVSLSVVLVSKLFSLSKIQGLCVGLLFGGNVTLTALFCTYIPDADADCMALLFACLAVYSFKKLPRYLNMLVSTLSMVVCLSLYQAYICVSIGLFLLLLMYEARYSKTWKDVISVSISGLRMLVSIIFATAIYLVCMRLSAKYYGIPLSTDYNGAGKLSSLTIKGVLMAIPKAYSYFCQNFLDISEINTRPIVLINWLMIVLLLVSIILFIIEHRSFFGGLSIVIPCIILMPLALNAIYLVSMGTMHQLMIFAFCLAYLVPIFLMSEISFNSTDSSIRYVKRGLSSVFILAIMVIGFNSIIYSNGAYVYKKLVYDNTLLHAQSIWKDINSIDGYIEDKTPVVFMGDVASSRMVYNSPAAIRYQSILTGSSNSSITYPGTASYYYLGILGRKLNIIYNDPELINNDEFMSMPIYPCNGYCKMIGNRVVVKLND